MKHRLLLTLVILVALAAVAFAQDGNNEVVVDPDLNATIVQTATNGTLTLEADDTYTLVLEGVTAFAPTVVNQPEARVGFYETVGLADDWATAAGDDLLVGQAELFLNDVDGLAGVSVVVTLEVSNPSYVSETGTFTYTATVLAVGDSDRDEDVKSAPEAFGEASLFLLVDADFSAMLYAGRQERLGTARPVGSPEDPPIP